MINPNYVHVVIEGTGADYIKISEALLDSQKVATEGVQIGNVLICGRIKGLEADLLEKLGGTPKEWKWRIHISMLPDVEYQRKKL